MNIRVFTYQEVHALYPHIYAQVFDRPPRPQDRPSYILLGYENNELQGFMSGYATAQDTLYVQRIGLFPHLRGRGKSRRLWKEAAAFLRDDGYRYTTGAIRTDNREALVSAILAGWRIVGFKQDSRGVGYVMVLLDLHQGGDST